MTEKLYKVRYFDDPNPVHDYVEYDDEYLNATDVVKLLNKLSKENEELSKENYGLQDGLDFYREQNAYLSEKINELEQELELYKHYVKLVPSNEW